NGISQLFRFDTAVNEVTQLTREHYDVFSFVQAGDTMVSNVWVPKSAAPPVYPVHSITRSELENTLLPWDKRWATFVSYRSSAPWELRSSDPKPGLEPWFSEDGRRAIAVRIAREVPDSWDAYDRYYGVHEYGEKREVLQFVYIDAEHGTDRT